MINEFSASASLDTFIALAKLARLKQYRANRTNSILHRDEAIAARERAVGYTAECIAERMFSREPAVFSPEVQARFSAVGLIIDRHIEPGRQTLNRRRVLIEKAEKFAPSSPSYQGGLPD